MSLQNYEENQRIVESVILMLGDELSMQVEWHGPVMTGGGAVVGGVAGYWFGGPLGAVAGAAAGAVGGYSLSRMVPLRSVWNNVRDGFGELLRIVADFLRRLDAGDIHRAIKHLLADKTQLARLAHIIRDYLADRLIGVVMANIAD